jgi:hypothetical protein
MKFPFKILVLAIAILSLFKCQKREVKESMPIVKEYGKSDYIIDSLSVGLKIENFKNFKNLLKTTENIVCNDSFPKLSFSNGGIKKAIYLQNQCSINLGCMLIKQKNIIEIKGNSIIKNSISYPLDSLRAILKRDIENNGENPELSDNTERLLIYVSFENFETKKFSETLNILTEYYEEITKRRDINIWLDDTIEFISKPPPPEPVRIEN